MNTVLEVEATPAERKTVEILWVLGKAWAITSWIVRYFLLGHPLRGKNHRKTNRTFFKRATAVMHPREQVPSEWYFVPAWQAAALRTGSFLLIVLVGYAWFTGSLWAWMVLTVIAGNVAVHFGHRGYVKARHIRHHRRVVKPFTLAVAPFLGERPQTLLRSLKIPPDYHTTNKTVSFVLPEHWQSTAEQRKSLIQLSSRKLGGDWDAEWTDKGAPAVVLSRSPVPPKKVLFREVLEQIRDLNEGQLLLGLGTRREPIIIDLDNETPHVALSIGTGGGKTSTLCLFIVQLAPRPTVESIDCVCPKMGASFSPVRGMKKVTIHRSIESQWDAIGMLRATMDQRYQTLIDNPRAVFSRKVLVIEESNSFETDSEDYWETIKERSDPKRPRVFRDIGAMVLKGRQVGITVISVFQDLTAKNAGGGAIKSQYGFKILGRFDANAWKRLVDIHPRPASKNNPGEVIVVDSGSWRRCQTVYTLKTAYELQDEVAAYLAESGITADLYAKDPVPAGVGSTDGTEVASKGDPVLVPVGLAEAVETGVLPVSVAVARAARKRDPEFPEAVGVRGQEKLYSPTALAHWVANRQRSQAPS